MARCATTMLIVALTLGLVAATGAQEQNTPEEVVDAVNELFRGEMSGEAHMDDAVLEQFLIPPPDGLREDKFKIATMVLYMVTLFTEPGVRVVDAAGDGATITYDPKPFTYFLKRQDGTWKIDVLATYNAMPAPLREMLDKINAGGGQEALQSSCLSNLKQIALGMLMYAQDHDEHLPDAATWMDDVQPYTAGEALFRCPGAPHLPWGYAMNASLSKRNLAEIAMPVNTVLVCDSDIGTRNAAGGPEIVCVPPRHDGGNNYAYVDGHAKWCTEVPSFGDLPQPDLRAVPGLVGTSTDESFAAEVLQAEQPVVVLFWSATEDASIRMSGTLRSLAGQYSDAAKFTTVRAETAPQTAAAHAVTTFPTLILFRDGEVVDRLVGSWDQDAVKVWLEVKLGG